MNFDVIFVQDLQAKNIRLVLKQKTSSYGLDQTSPHSSSWKANCKNSDITEFFLKKKSSLKSDLSYGFMELALPITLSICLPCLSTPPNCWKIESQIKSTTHHGDFNISAQFPFFLNNLRDILILKQSLCNNLLRGLPPA